MALSAALVGDLDTLKQRLTELQELGFLGLPSQYLAYLANLCNVAATRGHVHILEWLYEEGAILTHETMGMAAASGSIPMMEWLIARGCPLSSMACRLAANRGNLPALQWLRAQDPPCPWDGLVLHGALENGFPEVHAWAIANGCPEHVPVPAPAPDQPTQAWSLTQSAETGPCIATLACSKEEAVDCVTDEPLGPVAFVLDQCKTNFFSLETLHMWFHVLKKETNPMTNLPVQAVSKVTLIVEGDS